MVHKFQFLSINGNQTMIIISAVIMLIIFFLYSGTLPLNSDAKTSSHTDALYAYYYTDDTIHNVKVTEIYDFDDIKQVPYSDIQICEGRAEDSPSTTVQPGE